MIVVQQYFVVLGTHLSIKLSDKIVGVWVYLSWGGRWTAAAGGGAAAAARRREQLGEREVVWLFMTPRRR